MHTDLSKTHTLTFVVDSLMYRLLMYSTVKTALVQVVILQDLAPPPPSPPTPSPCWAHGSSCTAVST